MEREAYRFKSSSELPVQGSLFPEQSLLVPASLDKVKKAVSAIHMVTSRKEDDLTLTIRRLIDACIVIVLLDIKKRPEEHLKKIRGGDFSPMFEVPIAELCRIANIPHKNYQRVYDALEALLGLLLQWNVIGEDKEVEWKLKMTFLAELGIGQNSKQGMVAFRMPPTALRLCLEPAMWATFSLNVLGDLPTSTSYALFQVCFRYISNPSKRTPAMDVKTWVELICGHGRYTKVENSVEHINYAEFKRMALVPAINSINEIQALEYTLQLTEIKQGRRIGKLQFELIPKLQQPLNLPNSWPDELLKQLERIGFDEKTAKDLSQKWTSHQVDDALQRLSAAEARKASSGDKIKNRKAFFTGILNNITQAGETVEEQDKKIEAEVTRAEAEEQAENQKKEAEARRSRLMNEFSEMQISLMRDWLIAIGEEARDSLLNEFRTSALGKSLNIKVGQNVEMESKRHVITLRNWLNQNKPEFVQEIWPSTEYRVFEDWLVSRVG